MPLSEPATAALRAFFEQVHGTYKIRGPVVTKLVDFFKANEVSIAELPTSGPEFDADWVELWMAYAKDAELEKESDAKYIIAWLKAGAATAAGSPAAGGQAAAILKLLDQRGVDYDVRR